MLLRTLRVELNAGSSVFGRANGGDATVDRSAEQRQVRGGCVEGGSESEGGRGWDCEERRDQRLYKKSDGGRWGLRVQRKCFEMETTWVESTWKRWQFHAEH